MMQTENNANWKRNLLLIGAVSGAVVGAATAYLLARTAEENRAGPPQIQTSDVLKIGLNVIGTVRGIAALGS